MASGAKTGGEGNGKSHGCGVRVDGASYPKLGGLYEPIFEKEHLGVPVPSILKPL